MAGLLELISTTARVTGSTHRLIPSRYPPIGIFDTVSRPEDLDAVFELEGWTSDRLSTEIGKLDLLPKTEWVLGVQGANSIMAAFCYPNPDGGRFTGPDLGAWYCAFDIETAIAETIHHNRKRLLKAGMLHAVIQMRELVADIDAMFHDIRGQHSSRPELYDPNDYAASQAFGNELRNIGSNGLAYNSVRKHGGECLVIFRPKLLSAALQAGHWEYRWDGSPAPTVSRLALPE